MIYSAWEWKRLCIRYLVKIPFPKCHQSDSKVWVTKKTKKKSKSNQENTILGMFAEKEEKSENCERESGE